MTDIELILKFMHEHEDCVLSTVGPDGAPQSATVGFSENAAAELMIGTFDASRKYQNLLRDQRVSVVVGVSGSTTVQYEGLARQLTGEELTSRQRAHFDKIPQVEKYKDEPGEVYFSITPKWIRYTNFFVKPWEIREVRFGDERL